MSELPTTKRFQVLASDDLPPSIVAAHWPCNCEEFDAPHESCGRPTKGEGRWHLVEFDGDTPLRIVGSDGGAPEDQLLIRDWSWVADELNAQDERFAAAEAERDAARTAERIAVDHAGALVQERDAAVRRAERAEAAIQAAMKACGPGAEAELAIAPLDDVIGGIVAMRERAEADWTDAKADFGQKCASWAREIDALRTDLAALRTERDGLRDLLREAAKMIELLGSDTDEVQQAVLARIAAAIAKYVADAAKS